MDPEKIPIVCPSNCDWIKWGEWIKSEVSRAVKSLDALRDRMDSYQATAQGAGDAEHVHVEKLVQRTVDDLSAQIRAVSESVRLVTEACASNTEEIGKVKLLLAKNVPLYSAATAGVFSALVFIVKEVFGWF